MFIILYVCLSNKMTNLIPEGLFVDQIIKVAGSELKEECDYLTEAKSQNRYRDLVLNDPILSKHVYVPKVIKKK